MVTLTASPGIFTANKSQRVNAIAVCCLGLLSSREPPEYQAAAVQLYKNLIRIEADAVWLLLAGLAAPDVSAIKASQHTPEEHSAWLVGCTQPLPASAGSLSSGLEFRVFTSHGGGDGSDLCRVRKGSPSGRPRAEFKANCEMLLREMF